MTRRQKQLSLAAACLLAYLVAYFMPPLLIAGSESPDFRYGYHPGALGLQQGHGYVDANGAFITRWPPGYSLFIAPFIQEDRIASLATLRHLGAALAAIWMALLAWLARMVAPGFTQPLVLALAAAFWPPLLALANPGGSEMLFTTLTTLAACLLVWLSARSGTGSLLDHGAAFAAGLTLGLASLTKTLGISLSAAAALSILAAFRRVPARRRASTAFLLFLGVGLAIGPWLLEYQRKTGRVGFTTAGIRSVKDGFQRFTTFEAGREIARQSTAWLSANDVVHTLAEVGADDPFGVVRLLATKAIRPWYSTDSGRFDTLLIVLQLPWLVLFTLSTGLLLRRWRTAPPSLVVLHALVLANWGLAVVVLSIFRYLAPVFPLAILGVLAHIQHRRGAARRAEQS